MSELTFIGLDVHARSVSAGMPDAESGEVRSCAAPVGAEALSKWLRAQGESISVAYEAGPTGFGLARACEAAHILELAQDDDLEVFRAVAFCRADRPSHQPAQSEVKQSEYHREMPPWSGPEILQETPAQRSCLEFLCPSRARGCGAGSGKRAPSVCAGAPADRSHLRTLHPGEDGASSQQLDELPINLALPLA
jgi:hypothetical protein